MPHRPPSSTERQRARPQLLSALVAATALAGIALALGTWHVLRARDAQARAAMRDYAGYFAATVLASAEWDIQRALHDRSRVPVRARLLARDDGAAPPLDEWVRASDRVDQCRCVPAVHEVYRFRFDERSGRLETRGTLPDGARRWLADTLRVLPRTHGSAPAFLAGARLHGAVLFPGARHPGTGVALRFVYLPGGARVAYGYGGDLRPMLRLAVPDMMERTPLLPASLPRDEANAELVALEVLAPGGEALFRSAPARGAPAPGTAEVWTEVPAFGGVRARLVPRADVLRVLRPQVASGLVVPTLGATFLLLALAGVAAARIARREAQLVQARTDFLAGVSHELRTPLAQILLYADTLEMDTAASIPERRVAAGVVVQEVQRLSHLVDNVLHLVRGERQVASLRLVPHRLAPLVEEVVERFLPLAREAETTIELDLDEELVAELDRDAFTQILLNLLDNAVKHGGTDAARIRVGTGREGERVLLHVEDQGPGVAAEERGRIWEPFTRGKRSPSRSTGSGIGLAVVRDLTARHGGAAWVEAAPGGGARFVVRLPLSAATSSPVEA